jgi:hypothetical protein
MLIGEAMPAKSIKEGQTLSEGPSVPTQLQKAARRLRPGSQRKGTVLISKFFLLILYPPEDTNADWSDGCIPCLALFIQG